jgi:hypothetical protein
MAVELDPFGAPVSVGTVTLRTPGLQGTAEAHAPGSDGMRASELSTEDLERALANESIETQETIELTDTSETDVGDVPTRSTAAGEDAIEAEVADPGAAWGQFILYTDESGVTTWNFARTQDLEVDTTRGAATRTYVVRRFVPPAAEPGETRGLFGAVAKKVLKVLVFPLVDPVLGEVGDYFAHRWERQKRPYRIRSFTPEDFRSPDAVALDASAWDRLASGRGLLLVHGTFSRAHTCFGGFPQNYVADLWRKYEGRVFAFDHFTLSEDPTQNVEWLVRNIPEGASLDLDILCHSRGGLVSRVLAERQGELSLGSRTIRIRNVIFVAAPNAGTDLVDTKYIGDLIDSYTNILEFFPDNGVTDVLEGIITVAKQIAVTTVKGLEGLQSMLPGGSFLRELNKGTRDDKRYFALASDYEPTNQGLFAFAKDRLMDRIFQNRQNDLVVPTGGVFDANGSDFFPIAERYVFPSAEGVPHSGYFANSMARSRIREWLAV